MFVFFRLIFSTTIIFFSFFPIHRSFCLKYSSYHSKTTQIRNIKKNYRNYALKFQLQHLHDRINYFNRNALYLKTSEDNDDDDFEDYEDYDDVNFNKEFDGLVRDNRYNRNPRGKRIKNTQSRRDKVAPKKKTVVFNGLLKWEGLNKAVLAGIFIAGIGLGVTIDSAINTNPKDLASRDAIDRNAPNPKLCLTYGSSAMVLDQRVFVTFNPFNVYVTQADTKPGCVLRPSNVVAQLQKERKLLTNDDIESCKNGFNTWAFIGDINNKPQLNCVFQSDDAQNEFLSSNPKVGLGEDVYDKPGSPLSSFNPPENSEPTVGSINKFFKNNIGKQSIPDSTIK